LSVFLVFVHLQGGNGGMESLVGVFRQELFL